MTRYEKDSLGDRMKGYEDIPKTYLDVARPIVIRLDMRAGHSFCRHLARPFDEIFATSMRAAAEMLAKEIPGTRVAYVQSDEISLVLNCSNEHGEHSCIFDGAVEKLASVTASIATLGFNKEYARLVGGLSQSELAEIPYDEGLWSAQFDSRALNLPSVEEVRNYLMWRIMDARRNSVSMIGRSVFTQEALHGKGRDDIALMCHRAGFDIDLYPRRHRLGTLVLRYAYDKESEDPRTGEKVVVERHGWRQVEFDVADVTLEWVESLYNGEYLR